MRVNYSIYSLFMRRIYKNYIYRIKRYNDAKILLFLKNYRCLYSRYKSYTEQNEIERRNSKKLATTLYRCSA